MTAHWGVEDPAAVAGLDIDKQRAFAQAARFLKNRILAFVNLPLASIDRLALRQSSPDRRDGGFDIAARKVSLMSTFERYLTIWSSSASPSALPSAT